MPSGYSLAESTMSKKYPSVNVTDEEFALEHFINTLKLPTYWKMNELQKREYLEKVDALEVFTALQDINQELAAVKLENHFLNDFLERNDPRLLVGLKQRRATASLVRRLTISSNMSNYSSKENIRNSNSKRSIKTPTSQSIYTSGSQKKEKSEYRLNFKTKSEMADKAAAEVGLRVQSLQDKSMREIKMLNARIEELKYRCDETKETANNFALHFLRDPNDIILLESGSEKEIERKVRKFLANWMKNARALLSTMRLRITSLQESCQQHRSDLITKADLSGILGAVDFEQLIIKRNELLNALDDKNTHMQGLKGVTGRASLAMSEEKTVMMAIEDESRRIQSKTVEVMRTISKLEKESQLVEDENAKDFKLLQQLREQLGRFEAPSVNQYIERKDECHMLEKEERLLLRKTLILTMKLNNLLKQQKKTREDEDYA